MFGVDKGEFGKGIGVLLFPTFFCCVVVAAISDRFKCPRTSVLCALTFSCAFFQLYYCEWYIFATNYMFWINTFAYLVANTSIPALLDRITVEHLEVTGTEGMGRYGKQRAWGSVGYILSIFIIEAILGTRSNGKYDFTNLKHYSATTTVIAIILVCLLAPQAEERRKESIQSIRKGMWELVRNREYCFLMLVVLLNGLTRSAMTMYLPTYIGNVLLTSHHSTEPEHPRFIAVLYRFSFSAISIFEILPEFIILLCSQRISQMVGLLPQLLFGQIAQLLRFALYLILQPKGRYAFLYCCLFELLKGVNFGLTQSSGVRLAAELCPQHLKATSQMIYTGTFTAAGTMAAGLLFGLVFGKMSVDVDERKQFHQFFKYNVIITTASVLLLVYRCYSVWRRK